LGHLRKNPIGVKAFYLFGACFGHNTMWLCYYHF